MSLPVEIFCPLGSKCEDTADGKIIRCAWFTKLSGKNPQSEETIDEWGCAMSWMPLMQVEVAQTNRGQTEALCSMRDNLSQASNFSNKLTEIAVKAALAPENNQQLEANPTLVIDNGTK